MNKSRAFKARSVKQFQLSEETRGRDASSVNVGLDISKETIFAVLRWGMGDFSRPWKVENPFEVGLFVELLVELGREREMVVSLEPTGSYGDPLRQAMSDAGLSVQRVSPKASHDYAEIFDGVPSQHDGKDAAIVAELAALGKSKEWSFGAEPWENELSFWVDWMEAQRRQSSVWYGRLEGLLSRYWPEATRTLSLKNAVLLRSLEQYGSPAILSSESGAKDRLYQWGRGKLSREKIERLLTEARHSMGVRADEYEVHRIRRYAELSLGCRSEIQHCRRRLKDLGRGHEVLQSQSTVTGIVTACVLWSYLGDPRAYDSGGAYRKAMGLNLTERSSGKWSGRLKISKRGWSEPRRWLYYSALRWVKHPEVRPWFESKKQRGSGDGIESQRALIGIMRKLATTLYQVGVGKKFEPELLFPGVSQSAVSS